MSDERGRGARLAGALREATDDVVVPPGLVEGAVRRGQRRQRRRRWLGTGAAVLALVAGGGLAVQLPDRGASQSASPASGSAAGGSGAAGGSDAAAAPGAAAAPCDSTSVADTVPGFEGAPDPAAALRAWLNGDPSVPGGPPAGVPREGWVEEASNRGGEVVVVNGAWEATITRSSRGGWVVTSQSCR